ncbi:MAG: hypothetical protein U0T82_03585 [Bacteroidales bacterium]
MDPVPLPGEIASLKAGSAPSSHLKGMNPQDLIYLAGISRLPTPIPNLLLKVKFFIYLENVNK